MKSEKTKGCVVFPTFRKYDWWSIKEGDLSRTEFLSGYRDNVRLNTDGIRV